MLNKNMSAKGGSASGGKKILFALLFALLLAGCGSNYLNTNSQNQAPASDIILPTGYVGTRYSALLTIQGVTSENLKTVVEAKKLPAGISLELIELPCAPQATQCLPQPYLIGTPASSGNYQFVITTSSAKISYSLQIIPNQPQTGCNSNSDCQNGASCMVEGPLIAGQPVHKVCVPKGQAVPL